MEKTENGSTATTTDEPKINYRGIKAMPFVIGKGRRELPFPPS